MKIPTTRRSLFYILAFTAAVVIVVILMQPISVFHFGPLIDVIFPSGWVAAEERDLLFIIQALMLFVIVPVYVLTFVFSWKYSAQNPHGIYDPDLVDNKLAEIIWWGFPLVMTIIVCALTWIKTEQLDPFKPLVSDKKPITIQAIALQWKWLFIYPEEKIASLNFLQIPKDTPIQFEITSDAPMNSLWIPDLAGQIYAMPGMRTKLNLISSHLGDSRGSSANISGTGFAGMNFIARTSSEEDYHHWIEEGQKMTKKLDLDEYKKIAAPSSNVPAELFQLGDKKLFHQIIYKYMHP